MNEPMMLPQPPEQMPDCHLPPPPVMKRFGVMHYISASLSALFIVYQLVTLLFMDRFYNFMGKISGPSAVTIHTQKEMTHALLPYSWTALVLSTIVTIFLFRAAPPLMKGTHEGRIKSNQYAWSSIAYHVIMFILTWIFTIPLTKKLYAEIFAGQESKIREIAEITVLVTTVVTFLSSLIYPACCLIFLNTKKLKAELTARETSSLHH